VLFVLFFQFLRRDRLTGVDTVEYTVESTHYLCINNEADVTIVNVRLHCYLTLTPWCLNPRQLKLAVQTERSRLSPSEFALLEDSLRKHGLTVELS